MALFLFRNRWFERGKRLLDGDQLNTALGADVNTVANAVLATGVALASAAPVSAAVVVLDVASANNSGIVLVNAYPVGSRVTVNNPSANTVIVYPQSGTIAGGASSNIATTVTAVFLKTSATTWIKVQ